MQTMVTGSRLVFFWGMEKGRYLQDITKGHQETLGGDREIHFFNGGDGFTGTCICKFITFCIHYYTLIMVQ